MNKKFLHRVLAMVLLINTLLDPAMPANVVNAASTNGSGFQLDISNAGVNDTSGRETLKIDWEDVSFLDGESGKTKYYLFRKEVGGDSSEWELRGNYGKKEIKVLNVYPDLYPNKKGSVVTEGTYPSDITSINDLSYNQDGTVNWSASGVVPGADALKFYMKLISNELNNVNINVTTLSISEFNTNDGKQLQKNSDGEYNYDVVVFGFWDSNNYQNIRTSAANVVKDFIASDGGVIFGHDTMQSKGNSYVTNFESLIQSTTSISSSSSTRSQWIYSTKIKINSQSSATTYPFDINGQTLTIPLSHTVGQKPGSNTKVLMSFEENYHPYDTNGDGIKDSKDEAYFNFESTDDYGGSFFNYSGGGAQTESNAMINGVDTNAYLMVEGNVGLIQTGHSGGNSNLAEQKIMANLIYSLANIYNESSGYDQILDTISPNINNHETSITEDGLKLDFDATDSGVAYEYRIAAVPYGYYMRQSVDQMKEYLDNKEISSCKLSDSNQEIKFSKVLTTDAVGGNITKFRYYLDNVATGVVSGTEDVSTNSKLKEIGGTESITVTEDQLKKGKDLYLHIAAYDEANNVSKTYNVKIDKSIVNVKYVDTEGNEGLSPTEVIKLTGDTYTMNVPTSNKYAFQSVSVKVNDTDVDYVLDGEQLTISLPEAKTYNVKIVYTENPQYNLHVIDGASSGWNLIGRYYKGDSINVQASGYDGYTFLGWKAFDENSGKYVNYIDEDINESSEYISSDQSLSATMPAKNITLIACYSRDTITGASIELKTTYYYKNSESSEPVKFIELPSVHMEINEMVMIPIPASANLQYAMLNKDVKDLHDVTFNENIDGSSAYSFLMESDYADTSGVCNLDLIYSNEQSYKLTIIDNLTNDTHLYGIFFPGQTVNVTAYEHEGYEFSGWELDGNIISYTESQSIKMPAQDVTVNVNYTSLPYTVTVNNNVNMNSEVTINYFQDEVILTAEEYTGYRFVGWETRDVMIDVPTNETITLSMPSKNINVTANYEKLYYNVFATVNINETMTLVGNFPMDEMVSLEAEEYVGYEFVGWESSDVSIVDSAFTMPAKDVNLTGKYQEATYSVKINNTVDNIVTELGRYHVNDTVKVAAPSIEGYTFTRWETSDLTLDNTTLISPTFKMPAKDITLTATYEQIISMETTYSLKVVDGSASGSNNIIYTGNFKEGDKVTITAPVHDNLKFSKWKSMDVEVTDSTSTNMTFTMPAKNVTITAIYAGKYVVQVINEADGSIKTLGYYSEGDVVNVSVSEVEGYSFIGWEVVEPTGELGDLGSSYITSFSMPSQDVMILAEYELKDTTQPVYMVNLKYFYPNVLPEEISGIISQGVDYTDKIALTLPPIAVKESNGTFKFSVPMEYEITAIIVELPSGDYIPLDVSKVVDGTFMMNYSNLTPATTYNQKLRSNPVVNTYDVNVFTRIPAGEHLLTIKTQIDDNDATEVMSETLMVSESRQIDAPAVEGYEFAYWTLEQVAGENGTAIDSDVTIYADDEMLQEVSIDEVAEMTKLRVAIRQTDVVLVAHYSSTLESGGEDISNPGGSDNGGESVTETGDSNESDGEETSNPDATNNGGGAVTDSDDSNIIKSPKTGESNIILLLEFIAMMCLSIIVVLSRKLIKQNQ